MASIDIDVKTIRRVGRLGLVALGVALIASVGPLAPAVSAAQPRTPAPKVVIIVGPVGALTPYYRSIADDTAAAAAKLTPNVVKVYSPDATWERVKAELQGASIVVYLGHGNGWPSRYHDTLFPSSEDGFGLNPNAGAADAHQYFGETQIAAQIKLAKDAVVVFSHLCYASGNSEPGLPEGTLAVAQQRVDNYAAGFLKAGAGAVIADAYLSPKYYVTSILQGRSSVSTIWRTAPNVNDHFLAFNSIRTPGAIAEMDPDQVSSGFHRSLVIRKGLTSDEVIGGAVGRPPDVQPQPEPSLIGLGVTFGAPDLTTTPVAGTSTNLVLPVAKEAESLLPAKLMIGTRWDRLDGSSDGSGAAAADSPASGGAAAPTASTAPSLPSGTQGNAPGASSSAAPSSGPSASVAVSPSASAPPTASGGPSPSAAPAASGASSVPAAAPPTPPDLVQPEVPGQVVAPRRAAHLKTGGYSVPVSVPADPGLYRLVATVHDPSGLAYDAATQALIPALVVRVTGTSMAAWSVAATANADPGGSVTIPVSVSNLGSQAWGNGAAAPGTGGGAAELVPASRAIVTASWVPLTAVAAPGAGGAAGTAIVPAGLAPKQTASVQFVLDAPKTPGAYLLVFDVVVPDVGSLAALGVPPGIVRVTVGS
jgi:hypothetical protein